MYLPFKQLRTKIADINYAAAVLMWDLETNMPKKGEVFRSQQISTLSGMAHELFISTEMESLLHELEGDQSLTESELINVDQTRRLFNKKKKFTTAFVIEMSQTISETFNAWQQAKSENNLDVYLPQLEKLVKLKRQEAGIIGFTEHPYDALIEEYEPGMTVATLDILFADVKIKLKALLNKINSKPQVKDDCLFGHFDKSKQWTLGLEILKRMGYDFDAGRQDISMHPFTTSFSAQDVRVTTRIAENDIANMIWSCIHEGGHALYEQGLPTAEYGMPLGEATSLGVHESQSRLWENNVGRQLPFWEANYGFVQETFPEIFKEVELASFYKAMNKVTPSFVRTESDEITYHFHIMIRYEIEKRLMDGSLEVSQLKKAWDDAYKEYLGLTITDDTKGVLQDVHWSHGSFGYFPTYSLGSFYAAQYFTKACMDIPHLEHEIANGNNQLLLDWLRTNIHTHGKRYSAEELCKRVTGNYLKLDYFMNYVEKKYSCIYQF
jgi:carboxypeptidase Taq